MPRYIFLVYLIRVNSVGNFHVPFTRPKYLPEVLGTADHIRHAVSTDEGRLKFKAALLGQDLIDNANKDIKMVIFCRQSWWRWRWVAGAGRSRDDDKSNNPVQASNFALDWQNSWAYSRKFSTPNLLLTKISMSFWKNSAAKPRPLPLIPYPT